MARVCTAPLMTERVKDCTSASVMRPLRPVPLTSLKGTPSSRANLRTEGEAWGRPSDGVAVGTWAGAATALATTAGVATAVATVDPATAGADADAGAAAGAATVLTLPSRMANRSPILTLSPSWTLSSLMTPAALLGISIEALSDSTVIRLCSTLTASPALTMISITVTSLKSPMSGTRTSTGPLATAGAASAAGASAGAAGAAAAGAAAGAGVAASPATSSMSTSEPFFTLSPKPTLSSLTTPAWLDGISIEALSDSTVIRLCSALTLSPGLTSSSMTATSSKSPMSGTVTSMIAMLFFLFGLTRRAD